jgi:predicted xylose isomerase-like sugar epimerase
MAGGRYDSRGEAPKRLLSTNHDQIQAIGAKGVAGYYEFEPFSAIS